MTVKILDSKCYLGIRAPASKDGPGYIAISSTGSYEGPYQVDEIFSGQFAYALNDKTQAFGFDSEIEKNTPGKVPVPKEQMTPIFSAAAKELVERLHAAQIYKFNAVHFGYNAATDKGYVTVRLDLVRPRDRYIHPREQRVKLVEIEFDANKVTTIASKLPADSQADSRLYNDLAAIIRRHHTASVKTLGL